MASRKYFFVVVMHISHRSTDSLAPFYFVFVPFHFVSYFFLFCFVLFFSKRRSRVCLCCRLSMASNSISLEFLSFELVELVESGDRVNSWFVIRSPSAYYQMIISSTTAEIDWSNNSNVRGNSWAGFNNPKTIEKVKFTFLTLWHSLLANLWITTRIFT